MVTDELHLQTNQDTSDAEKYVSVTLMGGLGNNLFSLAHAFAYGKKHKRKCVLYEPKIVRAFQHSHELYENTIFRNYERTAMPYDQRYEEPLNENFICRHAPATDAKHIHLCGYFQHEGYFKEYREEFLASLAIPWEEHPVSKGVCFIHVRRGDYLSIPLHYVDLYEGYLDTAMEYVRRRVPGVRFLVFSNDPHWCEGYHKFLTEDVSVSHEGNAVATLAMMSRCEVGGICWNSSFSWWGAYMNPNPQKIVVFPKKWINQEMPIDIQFDGSIVLDD